LITTFLSKRQLFPGNNFVMLEIQGKEVLSGRPDTQQKCG
jgi:hypothetical protein